MNAGDPVWYRHVPQGGYGFGSDVPAEFVRATARRFIVRAWLKDGSRVNVAVLPSNVRPRDVDELHLSAAGENRLLGTTAAPAAEADVSPPRSVSGDVDE